jgi:hypothetical protein
VKARHSLNSTGAVLWFIPMSRMSCIAVDAETIVALMM